MKLEEVNQRTKEAVDSSSQHWSPVTVKSSPHTSEQWRSSTPTASATSCSSHARSPMLPTLPDFVHGTRLAASLNGEKKVFSFSPRWSEDVARRIQRPTSRVKTQLLRVSEHCTDSGPSTFSMSVRPKAKNSPP